MAAEIQVVISFLWGVPAPEREYRFAHESHGREWRFDFAWPEWKVAVEVEGGVFVQGRHARGAGMTNDCEKYNTAAMLGWKVLRFTSPMIRAKQKPPRLAIAKALGMNDMWIEKLLNFQNEVQA